MEEIKFTKAQLEAIEHDSGPALVVAGAGTGKTAVITRRIARLILSGKAKPDEVLALTFTEKASAEMQQRVDELLPYGFVDTQIMTFHALAEQILREFALEAGISPEFQILSDIQQIVITQELLGTAKYKAFNPQHDPFAMVGAIRSAISRLKDEGVDAGEYQRRLGRVQGLDKEELAVLSELGSVYSEYSAQCRRVGGVDFGDLLIFLQQLLKKRSKIRQEIVKRCKYILVDEFQDTNPLQMEILKLILGKTNNIMVVGDDDQAIYRFRGASVQNILEFRKNFPDAKIIVLNDNFRSGQAILDAGYRLIQNNNPRRLEVSEKINKQLRANTYPDAHVVAWQYPNKLTELEKVVSKIKILIEDGIEQKNIAILLRKNNQIKPYIQALQKSRIEYYVHQDVEIFEQPSVKTIVALCMALVDFDDSRSLFQLLISGFFNDIDRHEVIALSANARRYNKTLYEYLMESSEDLRPTCEQLKLWQELIPTHSAGELLFVAIKESGHLKRLLGEAETSSATALQIQYLTDFFKLVKQFELSSNSPNLTELTKYLDEIKLASAEVMSEISPLDIDGVQIMTVHKAKGLEFDYVFMPELTEQNFPTYRQADTIKFPPDIMPVSEGDHYEEERRLFYVGLTRARRSLWLSCALDHGGKRSKKPSRFIIESMGQPKLATGKSDQRSMEEIFQSFAPIVDKNTTNLLNRLYEGDWLYLSTNQIADYLRSPREFWLFHVLNMPRGPFHTLTYGSAIHAALEHYYRCKMASRPIKNVDIIRVFRDAWNSEGFVSAKHEEKLFETGKRALLAYITANSKDKSIPIAIEQPFELQLPRLKAVITGRYDIVFEAKDGVEIRDFKTSRVKNQKSADEKAKKSVQLDIYALSWEKLQQKPVFKTSLEFIEDMLIGSANKTDNNKTIDTITRAIEGIKNQQFDEIGQSYVDFNKLLT